MTLFYSVNPVTHMWQNIISCMAMGFSVKPLITLMALVAELYWFCLPKELPGKIEPCKVKLIWQIR